MFSDVDEPNTSFIRKIDFADEKVIEIFMEDIEVGETNKKKWFVCKVCNPSKKLMCGVRNRSEKIKDHLKNTFHIKEKFIRDKLLCNYANNSAFHDDLCVLIAKNNFSLNIVENVYFKQFMEKYCGKQLHGKKISVSYNTKYFPNA